jgi:arylsulfatase A-like enzyme
VHLFDVHGPRRAPKEHVDAFRVRDPDRARQLADFYVREQGVPLDFYGGDAAQLLAAMRAYDAELHFADAELAHLYAVATRQLPSPVLWIATADHGEGLGNHHFAGHGREIYEEHVRVPLIFHASDGGLAPRRVAAVVEAVDLAPTIEELARDDAPPPPEAQGRSLVPALLGQPLASRGAFVQRRTYASQEGELSEAERESYEPGLKFAVVEPRWKFVHRTEGQDELFDLARDPRELENLVGQRRDEAERLGEELRERIDALGAQRRDAENVDDETLEQLRALGYVP